MVLHDASGHVSPYLPFLKNLVHWQGMLLWWNINIVVGNIIVSTSDCSHVSTYQNWCKMIATVAVVFGTDIYLYLSIHTFGQDMYEKKWFNYPSS